MSLIKTNAVQTTAGKPILNSTGSILQVVQTVKTDNFSSTAKNSWTAITGLSLSITPSSSSNKVLILAEVSCHDENNYAPVFSIYRGALMASSTNNSGVSWAYGNGYATVGGGSAGGAGALARIVFNYLDSPATVLATTYQIYFYKTSTASSNVFINGGGGLNASAFGAVSSITAMEISG